MKIVSWNVNGIRSAIKHDFWNSVKNVNTDIICLQELKIDASAFDDIKIGSDYSVVRNHAEKKGYSGVAVFYKNDLKIKNQIVNIGEKRFDSEGRYLELDFGDYILINIYLPHGGRQKENLKYKLISYQKLLSRLKTLQNQKVILIGDFNIAHTELDLARPKNNKNNIMFTPEEREQIDKIIELGFIDTFRQFHKDSGHYTWWPWLANCRERNLGWRIDYAFVNGDLKSKLKDGFILDSVKGSDHCPIGLELK